MYTKVAKSHALVCQQLQYGSGNDMPFGWASYPSKWSIDMSHQADWNEMDPPGSRFASPNFNARTPPGLKPTHIVNHVTGTDSLASVSAHYLVGKDGALFQFVPDGSRAWHAGIESTSRNLYREGKAVWCRYLKYFSWYKGYPTDGQFVNGDLKPVWDKTGAGFDWTKVYA